MPERAPSDEIKWGSDSEHAPLREALLCRPDHYHWLPTSAISRATLESGVRFDHGAAVAQHAELVATLEGAGARCRFLEPDPSLPYQVFTRDSSLMTVGGLVITQPSQPWRRGEYAAVEELAASLSVPIWRWVTAGSLEGGDFVVVEPGCALIGTGEERTTFGAAEQLAGWLRELGWEVRVEPIPARYVHMDVLVCMVAARLALVCEEVISGGLLSWIRGKGIETIPVTASAAMSLGTNVLSLGEERVVSSVGSTDVNAALAATGISVLDPDLSAFTLGGGGPHCLTQALRRETLGA
jgi:N-dimethylarginine dimethylaminohydrolase